jgi:large subunit ribosomal protein L6
MRIRGPKGELCHTIPEGIVFSVDGETLVFSCNRQDKYTRSLYGTTRAIINNHVVGVSQGFTKDMEIHGQGYKAALKDDRVELYVGFSHPVYIDFDKSKVEVEVRQISNKLAAIKVSGIDKQAVGDCADRIRRTKPPESYRAKGGQDENKGIRYKGEVVRVKAGKSGK